MSSYLAFFGREDFKYYAIGVGGGLLLILITIGGCIGGGVFLCIFCRSPKIKESSGDTNSICDCGCGYCNSKLLIILCIILFSPLLLLLILVVIALFISSFPILAIVGLLLLLVIVVIVVL